MLNEQDYDFIFLELAKFEKVLADFDPNKAEVHGYYINYLNNYYIFGRRFDIKECSLDLVSMRHGDSLSFETPRMLYSELGKFAMNIIPTPYYYMENKEHNTFYDKGEFFNMNITGEITQVSYEIYEVFVKITSRFMQREYISENTKNIQIGLSYYGS